jgi:hypothetical protein
MCDQIPISSYIAGIDMPTGLIARGSTSEDQDITTFNVIGGSDASRDSTTRQVDANTIIGIC